MSCGLGKGSGFWFGGKLKRMKESKLNGREGEGNGKTFKTV